MGMYLLPGPKTYFRGKDAIDDIWVSEEIETSAAAYLPFDPELGDHRPVAVNISKKSLLGTQGPRIKPPAARRLNSKVKRIRQKYIDRLEEQFRRHRVLEKLTELEVQAKKEELSTEAKEALEKLDILITALMTNAENKCRKKYKTDDDFSPEVRLWIEKGRAIRAIIHLKLQNYNVYIMRSKVMDLLVEYDNVIKCQLTHLLLIPKLESK